MHFLYIAIYPLHEGVREHAEIGNYEDIDLIRLPQYG